MLRINISMTFPGVDYSGPEPRQRDRYSHVAFDFDNDKDSLNLLSELYIRPAVAALNAAEDAANAELQRYLSTLATPTVEI
jgi:hypothetical protein